MILKERGWFDKASTRKIITLLNAPQDNEARFVGGCVRDGLIGRRVSDVDIATTLLPPDVIKLLENHDVKVIPTGIDHGTVTAVIDGDVFEVTTLREDVSTDGRHAEVVYTTDWKKDASRRDFTMNALYLDQNEQVFDFFEGLEAIKNKQVIFIGDANQRIDEDYLRILRFFRFSSFYSDGSLDEQGVVACSLKKEGLKALSKERIRDELFKILKSPHMLDVLRVMSDKKILDVILPEAVMSKQFITYCQNPKSQEMESPELFKLLVLSNFMPANNLAKAFKLSNKQKQKLHDWRICYESTEALFTKLYYYGADIVKPLAIYKEDFDDVPTIEIWSKPVFPLSANDLKSRGVDEGKELGVLLKKGEKWWLENKARPSKDEILAYLF